MNPLSAWTKRTDALARELLITHETKRVAHAGLFVDDRGHALPEQYRSVKRTRAYLRDGMPVETSRGVVLWPILALDARPPSEAQVFVRTAETCKRFVRYVTDPATGGTRPVGRGSIGL